MRNFEVIGNVVDHIERHLKDLPGPDEICAAAGYSRYHLSRMFTCCAGFSMHAYIVRRRLTEAARALVETPRRVIDIALDAGYDNQQSFTVAFSALYGCTPAKYRAAGVFSPVQLPLHISPSENLQGDHIMEIRTEKNRAFRLCGFRADTGNGFQVIGMCWGQLHARKHEIGNRTSPDFLTALNDYSGMSGDTVPEEQPAFDYWACAEVTSFEAVPAGMETKELPLSDYIVFTYRGNARDSMEPVVNYIYKEWFPQSSCVLNGNARFDLVRYGEETDSAGNSIIEYWVPVSEN
ncbi:MAG: AraC family transcriptional regulator [Clostridiales bacterium]|nr:AraC family transcriptional regulator [Clostridiales bacterium]